MTCTIIEEPKIELTEQEAIRRAQAGDAAAFEFLYKTYSKRVYSVCLRMLRNPADAEDLTQQVFLRLFRKLGTFRGDSSFSTWLHRVAVNAVLMHLRKKRPVEIQPDGADQDDAHFNAAYEFAASDTSMLGAIERMNLMRAIRKLPAGCKRLFLLHDVFGYKHSEIAELVGCSVGCSKSQVHMARKRLRQLLLGERGPAGRETASAEYQGEALTEKEMNRHSGMTFQLSVTA